MRDETGLRVHVVDTLSRLHTITEVGKSLVSQLYGHDTTKSYFLGCSAGGRMGWLSDFNSLFPFTYAFQESKLLRCMKMTTMGLLPAVLP